jgi:hypothetical protein
MKTNRFDRREFVSTTAKTGVALCGLCMCGPMASFAGDDAGGEERIDLAGRCFCGYTCPDDCAMLQATLKDDIELKKKAWQEWKIEETYGVEFDPEQAICYGCTAMDKPKGIVLARCTVRDCAIEKDKVCCIDCDELTACDKDLWQRFPDFKKKIIELQEKYRSQA